MKKDVVYMKVTNDKYELPIYVCDSIDELSEKTNVKKASLRTAIYKAKVSKTKKCIYQQVRLEDE